MVPHRAAVAGAAVLLAFLAAGCSSKGSTAPAPAGGSSLGNASSARASASAAGSSQRVLGQPFTLGPLTITVSNPKLGGDDGGPWVTVDVTVKNTSTAQSAGFNPGIVCAGQTEPGGSQAASTLHPASGFPARTVDTGTLNLLSSGDTRTGQRAPACRAPASVELDSLDYGSDGAQPAPVRLQLPASVVTALNAARH